MLVDPSTAAGVGRAPVVIVAAGIEVVPRMTAGVGLAPVATAAAGTVVVPRITAGVAFDPALTVRAGIVVDPRTTAGLMLASPVTAGTPPRMTARARSARPCRATSYVLSQRNPARTFTAAGALQRITNPLDTAESGVSPSGQS